MSFSVRLKDERLRVGLSQQDMADIVKISQSAYQRYESGRSEPSLKGLSKIAKTLKVSVDYLLHGVDTFPSIISDVSEKYLNCRDDLSVVPVYDIQASAGPGAFNDDTPPVSCLALRNEFIKSDLKTTASALFVVSTIGDSMESVIRSGDMLLCDRSRKEPRADGIFIVRLFDSLMVKFVRRLPDKMFQLDSANKTYTPIVVEIGRHDFEIVARVVWICKKNI